MSGSDTVSLTKVKNIKLHPWEKDSQTKWKMGEKDTNTAFQQLLKCNPADTGKNVASSPEEP